ncbi:MAG: glycosyltransferase family 4 protein [Alphaproteobacteria bacterium]
MTMQVSRRAPTLVGHPYGTSGRSEDLREVYRALLKVGLKSAIYDIYGSEAPTPPLHEEFGLAVGQTLLAGVRIFLLNGDEVDPACRLIETRDPGNFARGYNIIAPTWELSNYPAVWARELERFAEIWAPSRFIHDSISRAVDIPVHHMPWPCEPRVVRDFGRRHFGIPEDRFAILFFWDAASYAARKNPSAVIDVFRIIIQKRPLARVQLVLKVNNPDRDAEALRRVRNELKGIHDRVTFIERSMTNDETKNLIRASDCFISLHRSEGFGRGLAEAMYFGIPVIGTAWSGNLDFMTPETSFLVDYDLAPVREGEYPHWADQHWAEAKRPQAVQHLLALIDNPQMGTAIGRAAGIRLRTHFSHRAQGVRYLRRIEDIERSLAIPPADALTSG